MSKTTTTTKTAKRGRPIVAGSKRQAVLAMRDAKRAQGIEIKRGRPAMNAGEKINKLKAKAEAKKTKTVNVKVTAKQDDVSVADDIKVMISE